MILFTADWHIKLGQKNVPVDWAKNRYKMFFEQVHELEKDCNMPIIGGDLFDRLPTMEELELYFLFIRNIQIPTIIYDGNHEAIKKHNTFFTNLKKASKEFFIKDYNIEKIYLKENYPSYTPEQFKALQVEEGIAKAMQSFLKVGKAPPKAFTKQYTSDRTILQKLFDRIKAFLSLIGFSFKQNGFNNAYDIFNAVQTGIIGKRIQARTDIEKIKIVENK